MRSSLGSALVLVALFVVDMLPQPHAHPRPQQKLPFSSSIPRLDREFSAGYADLLRILDIEQYRNSKFFAAAARAKDPSTQFRARSILYVHAAQRHLVAGKFHQEFADELRLFRFIFGPGSWCGRFNSGPAAASCPSSTSTTSSSTSSAGGARGAVSPPKATGTSGSGAWDAGAFLADAFDLRLDDSDSEAVHATASASEGSGRDSLLQTLRDRLARAARFFSLLAFTERFAPAAAIGELEPLAPWEQFQAQVFTPAADVLEELGRFLLTGAASRWPSPSLAWSCARSEVGILAKVLQLCIRLQGADIATEEGDIVLQSLEDLRVQLDGSATSSSRASFSSSTTAQQGEKEQHEGKIEIIALSLQRMKTPALAGELRTLAETLEHDGRFIVKTHSIFDGPRGGYQSSGTSEESISIFQRAIERTIALVSDPPPATSIGETEIGADHGETATRPPHNERVVLFLSPFLEQIPSKSVIAPLVRDFVAEFGRERHVAVQGSSGALDDLFPSRLRQRDKTSEDPTESLQYQLLPAASGVCRMDASSMDWSTRKLRLKDWQLEYGPPGEHTPPRRLGLGAQWLQSGTTSGTRVMMASTFANFLRKSFEGTTVTADGARRARPEPGPEVDSVRATCKEAFLALTSLPEMGREQDNEKSATLYCSGVPGYFEAVAKQLYSNDAAYYTAALAVQSATVADQKTPTAGDLAGAEFLVELDLYLSGASSLGAGMEMDHLRRQHDDRQLLQQHQVLTYYNPLPPQRAYELLEQNVTEILPFAEYRLPLPEFGHAGACVAEADYLQVLLSGLGSTREDAGGTCLVGGVSARLAIKYGIDTLEVALSSSGAAAGASAMKVLREETLINPVDAAHLPPLPNDESRTKESTTTMPALSKNPNWGAIALSRFSRGLGRCLMVFYTGISRLPGEIPETGAQTNRDDDHHHLDRAMLRSYFACIVYEHKQGFREDAHTFDRSGKLFLNPEGALMKISEKKAIESALESKRGAATGAEGPGPSGGDAILQGTENFEAGRTQKPVWYTYDGKAKYSTSSDEQKQVSGNPCASHLALDSLRTVDASLSGEQKQDQQDSFAFRSDPLCDFALPNVPIISRVFNEELPKVLKAVSARIFPPVSGAPRHPISPEDVILWHPKEFWRRRKNVTTTATSAVSAAGDGGDADEARGVIINDNLITMTTVNGVPQRRTRVGVQVLTGFNKDEALESAGDLLKLRSESANSHIRFGIDQDDGGQKSSQAFFPPAPAEFHRLQQDAEQFLFYEAQHMGMAYINYASMLFDEVMRTTGIGGSRESEWSFLKYRGLANLPSVRKELVATYRFVSRWWRGLSFENAAVEIQNIVVPYKMTLMEVMRRRDAPSAWEDDIDLVLTSVVRWKTDLKNSDVHDHPQTFTKSREKLRTKYVEFQAISSPEMEEDSLTLNVTKTGTIRNRKAAATKTDESENLRSVVLDRRLDEDDADAEEEARFAKQHSQDEKKSKQLVSKIRGERLGFLYSFFVRHVRHWFGLGYLANMGNQYIHIRKMGSAIGVPVDLQVRLNEPYYETGSTTNPRYRLAGDLYGEPVHVRVERWLDVAAWYLPGYSMMTMNGPGGRL